MHMKDGRRLYDHLIKSTTTTSMTADEVHELGLKEVGRIRAGMEAIRNEVGFKGTLAEFFEHLRTDPKFKAPSADWLRNRYAEIAAPTPPRKSNASSRSRARPSLIRSAR